MAEVYFYHLTRSALEEALPVLLEKSLAAGWRVELRGTSAERMHWLDEKLWLVPEGGFLPHGLAGGPHDSAQPVLLTTGAGAANRPDALILTDGAVLADGEPDCFVRVSLVFDGNDPEAVQSARGEWKRLTGAGHPARYWSQESGRWAEAASKNL